MWNNRNGSHRLLPVEGSELNCCFGFIEVSYLVAGRRLRSVFSLVERDSAEPRLFCKERNHKVSKPASSFYKDFQKHRQAQAATPESEFHCLSILIYWNSIDSAVEFVLHINITKAQRVQNSGYIQKLSPLGEAHSIVSSLQLWVLSQLGAHHGHLRIHVHEKPIFCVLQEEAREVQSVTDKSAEENEQRPQGGEAPRDEVTVLMKDQSKKRKKKLLLDVMNINTEISHSSVLKEPFL